MLAIHLYSSNHMEHRNHYTVQVPTGSRHYINNKNLYSQWRGWLWTYYNSYNRRSMSVNSLHLKNHHTLIKISKLQASNMTRFLYIVLRPMITQYGCFESFPFCQNFVIFVRQITWFRWNVRHWTSSVNVHNKNSNRYVPL